MSSVKRESNSIVISVSSLILDIEGTTTSISFVKDVLFPYVRKHLEEYINKNWESADFQDIVKDLKAQAKEDESNKIEGVITIPENGEKDVLVKAIIDNVYWQMDLDKKTKCLKDLQGRIMEEGYKKGELKGHIYDDVEPCLKSWTEEDKTVYIYSSGSVHAQKLLFGFSEKGDLLPLIKGHFDTTVGMKGEVSSYKKIIEDISCNPSEVAFLTDVPKEARAAKEAGMVAILVSREGNVPLESEDQSEFSVISSFVEIEFDQNTKKRKLCTENDVSSENKMIVTCAVSLDKESVPKDPKLNTNNAVEMMEVEENTSEETEDKSKADDNIAKDEDNVTKTLAAEKIENQATREGDETVDEKTSVCEENKEPGKSVKINEAKEIEVNTAKVEENITKTSTAEKMENHTNGEVDATVKEKTESVSDEKVEAEKEAVKLEDKVNDDKEISMIKNENKQETPKEMAKIENVINGEKNVSFLEKEENKDHHKVEHNTIEETNIIEGAKFKNGKNDLTGLETKSEEVHSNKNVKAEDSKNIKGDKSNEHNLNNVENKTKENKDLSNEEDSQGNEKPVCEKEVPKSTNEEVNIEETKDIKDIEPKDSEKNIPVNEKNTVNNTAACTKEIEDNKDLVKLVVINDIQCIKEEKQNDKDIEVLKVKDTPKSDNGEEIQSTNSETSITNEIVGSHLKTEKEPSDKKSTVTEIDHIEKGQVQNDCNKSAENSKISDEKSSTVLGNVGESMKTTEQEQPKNKSEEIKQKDESVDVNSVENITKQNDEPATTAVKEKQEDSSVDSKVEIKPTVQETDNSKIIDVKVESTRQTEGKLLYKDDEVEIVSRENEIKKNVDESTNEQTLECPKSEVTKIELKNDGSMEVDKNESPNNGDINESVCKKSSSEAISIECNSTSKDSEKSNTFEENKIDSQSNSKIPESKEISADSNNEVESEEKMEVECIQKESSSEAKSHDVDSIESKTSNNENVQVNQVTPVQTECSSKNTSEPMEIDSERKSENIGAAKCNSLVTSASEESSNTKEGDSLMEVDPSQLESALSKSERLMKTESQADEKNIDNKELLGSDKKQSNNVESKSVCNEESDKTLTPRTSHEIKSNEEASKIGDNEKTLTPKTSHEIKSNEACKSEESEKTLTPRTSPEIETNKEASKDEESDKTVTPKTSHEMETNKETSKTEVDISQNETKVPSAVEKTESKETETSKIQLSDVSEKGVLSNGESITKTLNGTSSLNHDKSMNNGDISESTSCEGKKCEAPENAMETVVEA